LLGRSRAPGVGSGCRARTAAAGGRPQAGLEFVEKFLTTNLTSTDTTERYAGMLLLLHPRPAPSASPVELATWRCLADQLRQNSLPSGSCSTTK
jgi:hypothetical protein